MVDAIRNKKLSYGRETARSLILFPLTSSVIRKIMHAQNWIFGPPYGGIRSNICALSEIFNKKKPCSRVSSRECQFYSYNSELAFLSHTFLGELRGNVCDLSLARWKADSRLSIGYD